MTYTICCGKDIVSLCLSVNTIVAAGWKPVGGLVIKDNLYYQALIKE